MRGRFIPILMLLFNLWAFSVFSYAIFWLGRSSFYYVVMLFVMEFFNHSMTKVYQSYTSINTHGVR